LAGSLAPWRLYRHPAASERYVAALRALLDQVWDETALAAEIDRMEALITPIADPDGSAGLAASLDEVRAFVRGRRASILAELDAGPTDWSALPREPPCLQPLGEISGSLQTTWGTVANDAFTGGSGALAATLDGVTLEVGDVGAAAGWAAKPARAELLVVAALADGTTALIAFQVDPARLVPGAHLAIDGIELMCFVYQFTPATGELALVGLVTEGTLALDDVATTDGAPVEATFSGAVVRSPF
jgi:hypothetical protein